MFEVLHELVDVVADLKGISRNRQAHLHARIEADSETLAYVSRKNEAAPDAAPANPSVTTAHVTESLATAEPATAPAAAPVAA